MPLDIQAPPEKSIRPSNVKEEPLVKDSIKFRSTSQENKQKRTYGSTLDFFKSTKNWIPLQLGGTSEKVEIDGILKDEDFKVKYDEEDVPMPVMFAEDPTTSEQLSVASTVKRPKIIEKGENRTTPFSYSTSHIFPRALEDSLLARAIRIVRNELKLASAPISFTELVADNPSVSAETFCIAITKLENAGILSRSMQGFLQKTDLKTSETDFPETVPKYSQTAKETFSARAERILLTEMKKTSDAISFNSIVSNNPNISYQTFSNVRSRLEKNGILSRPRRGQIQYSGKPTEPGLNGDLKLKTDNNE